MNEPRPQDGHLAPRCCGWAAVESCVSRGKVTQLSRTFAIYIIGIISRAAQQRAAADYSQQSCGENRQNGNNSNCLWFDFQANLFLTSRKKWRVRAKVDFVADFQKEAIRELWLWFTIKIRSLCCIHLKLSAKISLILVTAMPISHNHYRQASQFGKEMALVGLFSWVL